MKRFRVISLAAALVFVAGSATPADAGRATRTTKNARQKQTANKRRAQKRNARALRNKTTSQSRMIRGRKLSAKLRKESKISDRRFQKALKTRNWKTLMTVRKGKPVLELRRLTPTQRESLTRLWKQVASPAPQFEYTVDFTGVQPQERSSFAVSLFRGSERSPATLEAWSRASDAKTATVSLNRISYPGASGTVTFTNTPVGTIRKVEEQAGTK